MFTLDINGQFWLTTEKIVSRLKAESPDEKAFVLKSLAYVHQLSRNSPPLTDDKWIHSPEVFLNSLGKGYCDDRAAALCRIWQQAGLPARIWRLEGHTVPEVQLQGRWQLYDPETGVYFLKDSSTVCSVEEVANGEARYFSLHNAIYPLNPENSTLLFLDKYLSQEDNSISDWYNTDIPVPDSTFQLPAKAAISCCVPGEQGQSYWFAKVTLPPHSSGQLQAPLILAQRPEIWSSLFPKTDSLYTAVKIQNPGPDTLALYYYVNPFAPGLQPQNRFIMSGVGAAQLTLSLFPKSQSGPKGFFYLDELRERLLTSGELSGFIQNILPNLPEIKDFAGLPDFFHAYLLLQNMPPAEMEIRKKAFQERFDIARKIILQHPDIEERIVRNPVFLLLALEYYGKEADVKELATFLETLSL